MRSPLSQLFSNRKAPLNSFLEIMDNISLSSLTADTTSVIDVNVMALRTQMQDFCVVENKGNYPILNSAYYYNVAYKKKLIFFISQCNSMKNFEALMKKIAEETNCLVDHQDQLYAEMTPSTHPDVLFSNLELLIEATRKRLTLTEFYYHVFTTLSPHQSDNRKKVKNCALHILHSLRHISNFLRSSNFSDEMYKDHGYGIPPCRSICSIYESLRCSKILSNVKEVDMYCLRSPNFLNALCASYSFSYKRESQALLMAACYFKNREHSEQELALSSHYLSYAQHMVANSKSAINFDYFQQISGEHLQSVLKMQEKIKESTQKSCLFSSAIIFLDTHAVMALEAFDINKIPICIAHLQKLPYYIRQASTSLFENEELPFAGTIFLNLDNDTLHFSYLEEGPPRIDELRQRLTTLENTLENLSDFIKKVQKETDLTDKLLLETLINLNKEVTTQTAILSNKKRILKERELGLQKNKPVPRKPIAPIVLKSKKEKTSPHTIEAVNTVSSLANRAPLPAILPPLPPILPLPPAPINLSPEPTIHISQEQQDLDKKLKTQKYADLIKKQSSICPEVKHHEEGEEFSCEYAIFGRPVKARLDHDACLKFLGDKLFGEVMPKLNSILRRARITGLYGQGVKLVTENEKRILKKMGLLDPSFTGLVFKLKPKGVYGDSLRVYGKVITRNNEHEITFNELVVGKVHKKIERQSNSMIRG